MVTSGGLHGKVTGLTDDVLTVEMAPNVKIRVRSRRSRNVVKRGE